MSTIPRLPFPRTTRLGRSLSRALPTLAACAWLAAVAGAQTITVTTGSETIDIDPNDGTVADLPGPDGKVSFSEAMIAASNTPGHDTIGFAIPSGEWTFQFLFPGRAVIQNSLGTYWRAWESVTIDATTQTAFTGDTNPDGGEVVLYGSTVYLLADACTVMGLDSTNISVNGSASVVQGNTGTTNIDVFGGLGALVQGNTCGTIKLDRTSFNTIVGNTMRRIRIWGFTEPAQGNRVGGPTLAERNYITGYGTVNGEGLPSGHCIQLFETLDTVIENNWIGTTPDGLAQGNLACTMGISFEGENRDTSVVGNRIAGVLGHGTGPHHAGQLFGWGIYVWSEVPGLRLHGNTIGLDANGEPTLGSVFGIEFGWQGSGGVTDVQIGGTAAGQGNEIAGHIFDGIALPPRAEAVSILRNSIHSNGWLGIDLLPASISHGVTPNDPLDADAGGNGLQNFPDIASAAYMGGTIDVSGSLGSEPSTPYRIELFASSACDDSDNGEGEVYLGRANVTTDGAGNTTFFRSVAAIVPADWFVTATATNLLTGATSEFSACAPMGPTVQSYCTALPNSTGSAAAIGMVGSQSVAANDVTLTAGPVPDQPGLFYYGTAQVQVPFGDGFQCVGGFTTRLGPPLTAVANQAARVVDLAAEGIGAGQELYFQYWHRDPGIGGAGFNLSDGLRVPFLP